MKPLPLISAVASWMDNFKIPMREIKAKYTKSEISFLAWNSRLQSYNLGLGMKKQATVSGKSNKALSEFADDEVISPAGVHETQDTYVLPAGVNNGAPIKKKFFDEEGEIDLRRGTGPEVAGYLRSIGIKLPMVLGGKK